MQNRDIYTSALRLIGEVSEGNEDYEERAPYLLAAFCTESAETDALYRNEHSLEPRAKVSSVCLELDDEFPCADRFVSAASAYLAAMLVIDENMELSDKLFDRFCNIMATIQSEIPSKIEKIVDRYGAY